MIGRLLEMFTKRTDPPENGYSEIWDGDGWQVNRFGDRYLLINTVMPMLPCGEFGSIAEAQAGAERLGDRAAWERVDRYQPHLQTDDYEAQEIERVWVGTHIATFRARVT